MDHETCAQRFVELYNSGDDEIRAQLNMILVEHETAAAQGRTLLDDYDPVVGLETAEYHEVTKDEKDEEADEEEEEEEATAGEADAAGAGAASERAAAGQSRQPLLLPQPQPQPEAQEVDGEEQQRRQEQCKRSLKKILTIACVVIIGALVAMALASFCRRRHRESQLLHTQNLDQQDAEATCCSALRGVVNDRTRTAQQLTRVESKLSLVKWKAAALTARLNDRALKKSTASNSELTNQLHNASERITSLEAAVAAAQAQQAEEHSHARFWQQQVDVCNDKINANEGQHAQYIKMLRLSATQAKVGLRQRLARCEEQQGVEQQEQQQQQQQCAAKLDEANEAAAAERAQLIAERDALQQDVERLTRKRQNDGHAYRAQIQELLDQFGLEKLQDFTSTKKLWRGVRRLFRRLNFDMSEEERV